MGNEHAKARDKRIKSVDKHVRRLLDLVEVGRPLPAFSDRTYEIEAESSDTSETARGVEVEAKASPTQLPVSGRGSFRKRRKSQKSTTLRQTEAGEGVSRYEEARSALVEIIGQLGIERIVLLIDDWSDMDHSVRTAIQPVFADLLRRVFWGVPEISVVIASNQYQTSLSLRRGAGYEAWGLDVERHITFQYHLDRALLDCMSSSRDRGRRPTNASSVLCRGRSKHPGRWTTRTRPSPTSPERTSALISEEAKRLVPSEHQATHELFRVSWGVWLDWARPLQARGLGLSSLIGVLGREP